MHLRDRVVHTSILLKASFVVLVDFVHVNKHFPVDALRAGNLLVVELGDLEDVVYFVNEGRFDVLEVRDHLANLAIDVLLHCLQLFEQVVGLLLELALMLRQLVHFLHQHPELLLLEVCSASLLVSDVLHLLFQLHCL